MAIQLPSGKNYYATATGIPLVGGKVYAYIPGTSTPKDTYTTSAASVANTNPVILDSRGEAVIYWIGSYDIVLRDAAGSLIWGPERLEDAAGNLASTTDVAAGDALIGQKRNVTGSVAGTVHSWIEGQDFNVQGDFGGDPTSVSDQTAKIQAAITALPARGGTIEVPRGVKFNLQSLTFAQRTVLRFYMDDDLSRPNPITTLGTSELVTFIANANGSGIVNEDRITSAFHPGFMVDVRRDVAGHDAHLGASQKRIPDASTPARASYNIMDQQVDTWRTVYEIYGGTYSQFTGITTNSWRRVVTITGIGTGAGGWVSVPAVGIEITGNTSGAKGWFLSATATTTTILWNSGNFVVGEKLIDNNETTVNNSSAVAFSLTQMQPFGTDLRKGGWSFGLPVGMGDELVNMGGRLQLLPTRTFSQYVYKTITHPGLVLSDLVSDIPTNGWVLHYDTTAAAASRRPTWRSITSAVESTQDRAHAAAVTCFVQFTNSAIKSTSSFNCTSVTRTGTGTYEINIPSGVLTTLDPCVTFGTEHQLDYPTWDSASSTLTKLVIKNYTTGTSTLVNLSARVSVSVVGGDI